MDLTTPPEGYTEEEWTGLSESEREGIMDSINDPDDENVPENEHEEGEFTEDDLKKIVDEVEGKPPEDEGGTKKDEEKPDDETQKKPDDVTPPPDEGGTPPDEGAKPPEEKPAETKPEQHEITDEDLLSYRPNVMAEELKLEEVIPDDLQTKLNELQEKYDDGGMTIHEYNAQRDSINRQIYKHNATLEAEARNNLTWQKEQLYFLKARPEYLAKDKTVASEKIRANALFGALSEMVRSLSSDEANGNLSGIQLLLKADAEVKKAFGIVAKPPEKKVDGKPVEKKTDDKTTDGKKPPAPLPDNKTLSQIPSAAKNDDDAFALLDKLTGEKYEEALEKLPEAVREAYLNRA